jgi:lipoate-protein ligase A
MANYLIDDWSCTDPWRNLAMEECLLSRCGEDDAMLYLWQNADTVVIGRHQNPWRECRPELLEQEGGRLARRITGGGAVFHDLGNLNFSFIMGKSVYDVARHLGVVIDAVRHLGVGAEFSGRNDILSAGRKFSGNAFARRPNASLHHGTLLVRVDMAMLGRYLNVPQAKMESKGIQSVQSRVVNLSELNPAVTVEALRGAMAAAFRDAYGAPEKLDISGILQSSQYAELLGRQQSWEWRFGQSPRFDVSAENRFPWGGVELQLASRDGRISDAAVYSDAMDEAFISAVAEALIGLPFSPAGIAEALQKLGRPEADDLARWVGTVCF